MERGKPKPTFGKPKLDRRNFMFVGQSDQELMKKPGDINGQAFKLENLSNCTVWLMDHFAQIYVDNCKDCKFFIGAIKGSIQVRKSENCQISVACQQFRCTDLNNSTIFLCVNSQPTIESSTNLLFAPYNFGYPDLREHLELAAVNPRQNYWRYIHDMTPGEGHWKELDPSQFQFQLKEVEGMELPELVVPIPIRYGGEQEEHEEATLETEMGGFTIAKSKEEAEKQMKVLEKEEIKGEVTDKFAGLDLEAKGVSPKGGLDDYYGEDMELIHKKEQIENERQSAIRKKQMEEQKKKAKRQEEGAKEFNDWIENWKKKNAERREKNLKAQKEKMESMKGETADKNPWEKVMKFVDAREGGYKGAKDVNRMKAVMGGRKEDFEKGAAKFD